MWASTEKEPKLIGDTLSISSGSPGPQLSWSRWWHRVVSFGKPAEYARTLTKGSHVMVQGAVRTREYERDGLKHRVFELRADTIGKLDRAERRQDSDSDPDASEV